MTQYLKKIKGSCRIGFLKQLHFLVLKNAVELSKVGIYQKPQICLFAAQKIKKIRPKKLKLRTCKLEIM